MILSAKTVITSYCKGCKFGYQDRCRYQTIGEPVRYVVERITYYENLPDELFEFEIPEGATVAAERSEAALGIVNAVYLAYLHGTKLIGE
ncbi:MAG: hypothetical protein ACYSWW_08220 [Planctomycetota bacterium]|jgi:hypothetical protein